MRGNDSTGSAWRVEFTQQFRAWWQRSGADERDAVAAAAGLLQRHGPALGPPFVEPVRGSRYLNLRELRPPGTNVRVPLAFDPRRGTILLISGDPGSQLLADRLYDEYLAELRVEETGDERTR